MCQMKLMNLLFLCLLSCCFSSMAQNRLPALMIGIATRELPEHIYKKHCKKADYEVVLRNDYKLMGLVSEQKLLAGYYSL